MKKRLLAALFAGMMVLTCFPVDVNAASAFGGARSRDITVETDGEGHTIGSESDGVKYGTMKSGTNSSGSTKSGTTSKSGATGSTGSKSGTNSSGTTKSGTTKSGTNSSGTTKSGTTKSGTNSTGTTGNASTKSGIAKYKMRRLLTVKEIMRMTEDGWLEWFSEEYPFALNDLYGGLPYNNMIGAKLADLKAAVEKNEKYSEDTSTWTTFETMTGYRDKKIAYSFSNRKINAKGEDAVANGLWKGLESLAQGKSLEESINDGLNKAGETIDSNISKGAANAVSSVVEDATYYYVTTDGSKDQIIDGVYVVAGGNIQEDIWEPFEKVFYNTDYKTFQVTYNKKTYDRKRLEIIGNVAKIDYRKTYESIMNDVYMYEGSGILGCYSSADGSRCILDYKGAWLK